MISKISFATCLILTAQAVSIESEAERRLYSRHSYGNDPYEDEFDAFPEKRGRARFGQRSSNRFRGPSRRPQPRYGSGGYYSGHQGYDDYSYGRDHYDDDDLEFDDYHEQEEYDDYRPGYGSEYGGRKDPYHQQPQQQQQLKILIEKKEQEQELSDSDDSDDSDDEKVISDKSDSEDESESDSESESESDTELVIEAADEKVEVQQGYDMGSELTSSDIEAALAEHQEFPEYSVSQGPPVISTPQQPQFLIFGYGGGGNPFGQNNNYGQTGHGA